MPRGRAINDPGASIFRVEPRNPRFDGPSPRAAALSPRWRTGRRSAVIPEHYATPASPRGISAPKDPTEVVVATVGPVTTAYPDTSVPDDDPVPPRAPKARIAPLRPC